MRFALILSLLIGLAAVVFAIYNTHEVDINVLDQYRITAPLAIALIGTLGTGVLIGVLASLPSNLRSRAEVRRRDKRIAELEEHRTGLQEERTAMRRDQRDIARERNEAERRAASASLPSDPPPADDGAAETQRLAAETQRMAADAQRRANEADRNR